MTKLAVSLAVALLLAVVACGTDGSACTSSGGTVVAQLCCRSAAAFPNTCAVGACGCSPENSAPLDVCHCPDGGCFDGTRCVPR